MSIIKKLKYSLTFITRLVKSANGKSLMVIFALIVFTSSGQRIDPEDLYGEPYDIYWGKSGSSQGFPLWTLWIIVATGLLTFLMFRLINISEKPCFKKIRFFYLTVVFLWLVGLMATLILTIGYLYVGFE
jgi:hypothetical protein